MTAATPDMQEQVTQASSMTGEAGFDIGPLPLSARGTGADAGRASSSNVAVSPSRSVSNMNRKESDCSDWEA